MWRLWQYFGFLCLLEMCCVTSHLLFPWNFSFLPFHVFLACGRGPSVFCKDPSLSPASIKFRSDFFIDHWRMLHICTLPRVSSFHVFLTSFHSPMGLISVSCFSCCLLWSYCLRNALPSSEAGRGLWGGLQRLLVRRTTTSASAV